jgi:plasmid stability protein
MSKTIQIRNVPDRLHRRLKARAAKEGMSLSSYLLSEIREIAERPALAEFHEISRRREPVTDEIDTARIIREHRDAGW